jgi:hypothetical protein
MKREEEPEAERRNIHGWSGGKGKEVKKKRIAERRSARILSRTKDRDVT